MSKDLTSTIANIAAHSSPKMGGGPQKGKAERASPSEQVSNTPQIIILVDIDMLSQGNGQQDLLVASRGYFSEKGCVSVASRAV